MSWKNHLRFLVSIMVLLLFVAFLGAAVATSAGLIDLKPEPVTKAEQNSTGVPAANTTEYPSIDGAALEMEIFNAVNERRTKAGADPFVHSQRVRLIARIHSADMAERKFFNHTNPDGIAPPGRHQKYQGCDRPNENIAVLRQPTTNNTETLSDEIVSLWRNSEGHNTSMMTSFDRVTGVGVYVTKNKDIYVTQNFCREHPNA